MTKLSDILNLDLISIHLSSTDKPQVLSELGELLASSVPEPDGKTITKALVDRENLATTGVGEGVAIPHAKLEGLDKNRLAVGISQDGIDFEAVDGKPVHIIFALIAPIVSSGDHLRILAQISRLLKDSSMRARLVAAEDAQSLISIIKAEEDGKS